MEYTNITVKAKGKLVGKIQEIFVLDETYCGHPVIKAHRILLHRKLVKELDIFQNECISAISQKVPFQILITKDDYELELVNAWIIDNAECTYSTDECLVWDVCKIAVEDIFD